MLKKDETLDGLETDNINNLKVLKRFQLQSSEINIEPIILEILPHYFTWPSAMVMSAFIVSRDELFRGKKILEIGGGTGLVSVVASTFASDVYATERHDERMAIETLEINMKINCIDNCFVKPLSWAGAEIDDHLLNFGFDVIIGSDVFYSSEDFDPILNLVNKFMEKCSAREKQLVFYSTYQERSSHRTIAPYLHKFDMKAEVIPLESFLHYAHLQSGICPLAKSTQSSGNASLTTFY